MTSSPPQAPRANRSSRLTLSILAFLAIAAAALAIYTGMFKDDVVMARFTAVTGDFAITPTADGLPAGEQLTAAPSTVAGFTPVAQAAGPGTTPTDDASGSGSGDATDSDDDLSLDGDATDEPTASGAGAPSSGPLLSADGFSIETLDNMVPGERRVGGVTVQNVASSDIDFTVSTTGSDTHDCFTYTLEPRTRDAGGAWVASGAVLGNGSPAIGSSSNLGVWRAGELRRFLIAIRMNETCTVGSGLSSNGSTARADRHPDNARATLAITFLATGSNA